MSQTNYMEKAKRFLEGVGKSIFLRKQKMILFHQIPSKGKKKEMSSAFFRGKGLRTLAFTRCRSRSEKGGNSNSRNFCYHDKRWKDENTSSAFFSLFSSSTSSSSSGVILQLVGGSARGILLWSLTLTVHEIIIWDLNPTMKGIEGYTCMTHFIPMHLCWHWI